MYTATDYILDGKGYGSFAEGLGQYRFDSGYYRPYFNEQGKKAVTINQSGLRWNDQTRTYQRFSENTEVLISDLIANGTFLPVWNYTTMPKELWLEYDKVVKKATRQRLSAWNQLVGNGVYNLNGMNKMILEHEQANDPGVAIVDMFGEGESENHPHAFQLRGLPLPITHSGWNFYQRQISVASELDTLRAEAAGRRIGEMIEKLVIGTVTGPTYGGNSTMTGGYDLSSKVFGWTNYTNRNTKTNLTTPTGANPNATVTDVLSMRETMYQDGFFGPFMLFHSTDWDQYLDADYAFVNSTGWAVNPTMTLRQRLSQIGGINGVQRLDYLTSSTNPFTLLMIQMTPEVCRAINGMDLNVLQWEEKGGQRLMYKAMCIYVPQIFSDYNGNCGILHATTS